MSLARVTKKAPARTIKLRRFEVRERKAWREKWERGAGSSGDRYFGEDYRIFQELEAGIEREMWRIEKRAKTKKS